MTSKTNLNPYSVIPQKLRALPNWVVWRMEKRNGSKTKIPYDAKNGRDARSNDPSTWTDFAQAVQMAETGKYSGIGFQLLGTPFVGFDFDGVVQDGHIDPYVQAILTLLPKPYIEITPSSTGVRAFVEYDKPLPPGKRKFDAKKKGVEKYGAEVYSGREKGRYLTLTGNKICGEDVPVVENVDLAYFLVSRFSDDRFKRMWMGDASDYENDDSRLDLALLGYLVRAFDGNTDKALQYFNASTPGHREKWLNRDDYVERTMLKAATRASSLPKDSEERKDLEFKKEIPPVEPSAYDYVVAPLPESGQFEGWFPLGSPSLIGGSSGSGKTTFMLDLCVRQVAGQDFYGHPTFQRPYLVLMLDRGKLSHERTMRRMNMMPGEIPIRFLKAVLDDDASQEIISQIEACETTPQLVFIEGMDMLVSDPNKMEIVSPFMREMQEIATHFHCAIVGSVGAPKSKPKDGYTAKRDTIFGSSVWSRMAETVVTVQFPQGDDTADQRSIAVLPRNAKAEKFETEFQHGRLSVVAPPPEEDEYVPTKKEREEKSALEQAVAFILRYLASGPKLKTEVINWAKETEGIGHNAIDKASAEMYRRGVLAKRQNGPKQAIWELVPVNATAESQKVTQFDQSKKGEVNLPFSKDESFQEDANSSTIEIESPEEEQVHENEEPIF